MGSSQEEKVVSQAKKDLPKVDVLKRREMFEKEASLSTEKNDTNNRLSNDFSKGVSIRERLSHLEKRDDVKDASIKKINRMSGEFGSVKDRLSTIEKPVTIVAEKKKSIEVPVVSIKDRLSSLQQHPDANSTATEESAMQQVVDRDDSGILSEEHSSSVSSMNIHEVSMESVTLVQQLINDLVIKEPIAEVHVAPIIVPDVVPQTIVRNEAHPLPPMADIDDDSIFNSPEPNSLEQESSVSANTSSIEVVSQKNNQTQTTHNGAASTITNTNTTNPPTQSILSVVSASSVQLVNPLGVKASTASPVANSVTNVVAFSVVNQSPKNGPRNAAVGDNVVYQSPKSVAKKGIGGDDVVKQTSPNNIGIMYKSSTTKSSPINANESPTNVTKVGTTIDGTSGKQTSPTKISPSNGGFISKDYPNICTEAAEAQKAQHISCNIENNSSSITNISISKNYGDSQTKSTGGVSDGNIEMESSPTPIKCNDCPINISPSNSGLIYEDSPTKGAKAGVAQEVKYIKVVENCVKIQNPLNNYLNDNCQSVTNKISDKGQPLKAEVRSSTKLNPIVTKSTDSPIYENVVFPQQPTIVDQKPTTIYNLTTNEPIQVSHPTQSKTNDNVASGFLATTSSKLKQITADLRSSVSSPIVESSEAKNQRLKCQIVGVLEKNRSPVPTSVVFYPPPPPLPTNEAPKTPMSPTPSAKSNGSASRNIFDFIKSNLLNETTQNLLEKSTFYVALSEHTARVSNFLTKEDSPESTASSSEINRLLDEELDKLN